MGQRRFEQLQASPDLLQHPSVKAAIEAKLASTAGITWTSAAGKLTWMDPAKKRDFGLCKCCGKLNLLKMKAVWERDPKLHRKARIYMNHHLTIARMRWDKFVTNQ